MNFDFAKLDLRLKEHLQRMWTVDRERWVIFDDGSPNGPILLNIDMQVARIFEVPEEREFVLAMMRDAGVRVVNKIPWIHEQK